MCSGTRDNAIGCLHQGRPVELNRVNQWVVEPTRTSCFCIHVFCIEFQERGANEPFHGGGDSITLIVAMEEPKGVRYK